MTSSADIIKQARTIIERGWHRGDYSNEGGTAFCILGALEQVDPAAMYGGRSAGERAIEKMIRHAYPEDAVRAAAGDRRLVSYFNDDIALSKQDVLDLFDKTLADLGGLA